MLLRYLYHRTGRAASGKLIFHLTAFLTGRNPYAADGCIQSIKTLMDEIAAAGIRQTEMISLVESGIKEISAVVQDNSAAAEKSAAVSRELSHQARALNSLISRFRIR